MAVGAVVLLVSAALLGQTGIGYERVGGGIGAEREARALLIQLAADMANARHHPDNVFEEGDAGWRRDRLGFLTLQPADAQSAGGRVGDLCAVHYYVKDLPIGGRTVRCLMRGFRESGETFGELGRSGVPGLFEPRERDEPVAFNVVSFEVGPVVRGGGGAWEKWSKASGSTPAAIDLRLVIARRDLAPKLTHPAEWDGGGRTAHLLGRPDEAAENPGLEVFATTIRFGNHGMF